MSKAQDQPDSTDLPEPTAEVSHPDNLEAAAKALRDELTKTYSNHDGTVTVEEIKETPSHFKRDAKVKFPSGTIVSSSTIESALKDTAYDLHGIIVHHNGNVDVELVRSDDE